MNNRRDAAYVSRYNILMLLSDEEIESVCVATQAGQLEAGAEYLDLEQLVFGVQTAPSSLSFRTGRLLTRSSVSPETWEKVVALLGPSVTITTCATPRVQA